MYQISNYHNAYSMKVDKHVPSPSYKNKGLTASDKLSILLTMDKNPSLFVFDLDYTIWPFDCENQVKAPFTSSELGALDKSGNLANPFIDVPNIFEVLIDAGIKIAYASRNPNTDSVKQLLTNIKIAPKTNPSVSNLWDVLPSIDLFHAYSSNGTNNKELHFAAIQAATGLDFKDMLFFDDDRYNIAHAKSQGTTCVHLGYGGLTFNSMMYGIHEWRRNNA